ncbi:hypothetical protein DSO57_1026067 [Entomophthora muscae]|uniref:Uncharacterized protein n=1 Tax=Entomophthora muscae TaxID=34485 RepID=A0ACC2UBX0_9FUNG|nr:hypothetical protein DSO57_1026067 [Entomophthora muscae]
MISSSVLQVGDNPSHLLYLMEDLPGRAQDLLISGKKLMKSLTCDDLDLLLLDLPPRVSCREDPILLALLAETPTHFLCCTCSSGLQNIEYSLVA